MPAIAQFIETWLVKYPTIKRYFDENTIDDTFMVIKEFEEKNLMKYPVTNYKYFTKINNA